MDVRRGRHSENYRARLGAWFEWLEIEANSPVAARTLPADSASTSILKKLKFQLMGTVETPKTVWFGSGSWPRAKP